MLEITNIKLVHKEESHQMGQAPLWEEEKRWGILSLSSYIREENGESKRKEDDQFWSQPDGI